jgi:hypothetical protein
MGKGLRAGKSDRRRESRDSVTGEVSILCEDEQGHETVSRAKLLDVSPHGARFWAHQELPVRSSLIFYHVKLGVGGRGTVRYCHWSRLGYEIGVEFHQGTSWDKPLLNEQLKRLGAALDHPEPVESSLDISKTR